MSLTDLKIIQGGPLAVINEVTTPINALINGFACGYNLYKWSYNPTYNW